MALNIDRPFLPEHVDYCFRRATCGTQGADERWEKRAQSPMTDKEVEEALRFEIGEFGGGCGPDTPSYEYQSNGLNIWGSWPYPRRSVDRPILAGAATIAKAREFFGIRKPTDERQYSLFG